MTFRVLSTLRPMWMKPTKKKHQRVSPTLLTFFSLDLSFGFCRFGVLLSKLMKNPVPDDDISSSPSPSVELATPAPSCVKKIKTTVQRYPVGKHKTTI